MNYKICNNKELYDNKYINHILNRLQIIIFESFNKLYPLSRHTNLDCNWKFKIFCFDNNSENLYIVQVSISYDIFNDSYICRLNILENDYTNINNIYLQFTAEEINSSFNIPKITEIIKDFLHKPFKYN